jgi:bacterioferritin-associated ferredoxin
MIVCCCKAVSSKRIEQLAADGHDTVEAIGRACGAGTDCGACRTKIGDMLEEAAEAALVPAARLVPSRAA